MFETESPLIPGTVELAVRGLLEQKKREDEARRLLRVRKRTA